jgi:hypothetical protein
MSLRLRLAVWLTAAAVLSCSVPQEQSLLDRFFSASRLRDRTALSNFATVVFEPLEQGIVTDFDILEVVHVRGNAKSVTIGAAVKLPDGQVVEKTLSVTLERRSGAWMVTQVQEIR